ncbi:hypothetical protein [Vibrio genomosp. F10]|nr:hypothetical protein [Vibrio genomosp. F10]
MYSSSISNDTKIQRFVIESSKASGFNLVEFFEKWGINVTTSTKQEVNSMKLSTLNVPIWENRDNDIKYTLK